MPMIRAGKSRSRFGGDDFGQTIATSHDLIKGNPLKFREILKLLPDDSLVIDGVDQKNSASA